MYRMVHNRCGGGLGLVGNARQAHDGAAAGRGHLETATPRQVKADDFKGHALDASARLLSFVFGVSN